MARAAGLDWLYALQHFGIKLGLRNIQELLSRLGNPHHGLPCAHVAGTNGKGSVSLLLSEIGRHSGYRVGLYTSPHLQSFNERIQIDGRPLPDDELTALLAQVRQAATGIPVTFFEAATALALLAFHRAGVDFAVIETGMGGRLDATNVVEPKLCCITPVGLDHQEHLGATLAAIAAEKAGIIKTGVPVITAGQTPEVDAVLAAAAARHGAELWRAGRDYQWGGDYANLWFNGPGLALDGLTCALQGEHQLDNFAQAITAAALLRRQGMSIPEEAIRRAGSSARWPGRLEWFGAPPRVLLDGAHNRLGATALASYLQARGTGPVHLVAGLSGQRTPDEVLAPLLPVVTSLYVTPVPEVATVPPEAIAAWGETHGLLARTFAVPAPALAAALAACREEEIVVVAGSLYLVAAVRSLLLDERILPSFREDGDSESAGSGR